MRDDIMGADTAHPQTVECLQEVIADPVICHWCGSVFTDHQCGAEGVLMLHETATELVQVAAIAHAWHDGLDPIESMQLGYRRPTQTLPPPSRGGWRLRDLLTAQGHVAAQLGAVSDHCAPVRMPGRHAGGGCGCPAMQELRAALLTIAGVAAGWADQVTP